MFVAFEESPVHPYQSIQFLQKLLGDERRTDILEELQIELVLMFLEIGDVSFRLALETAEDLLQLHQETTEVLHGLLKHLSLR